MKYTLLRVILDVVVLHVPYDCAPWMIEHLPFKPANPEMVRLDPTPEPGTCIIRYRSSEIELPPDFRGA